MNEPDHVFNAFLEKILPFRNARDSSQFHNPKGLAIALSVEAGELPEAYLWKADDQASPGAFRAELANVVI